MKRNSKVVDNADLLEAINNGFTSIEKRMVTKEEFSLFQGKNAREHSKLEFKIDAVQESVETLEEVDVRDLQRRVQVLEKAARVH